MTTPTHRSPLAEWQASPNFNVRQPHMIVLHHTEMRSWQAALKTLQTSNPFGPVSAHYLIGADGTLLQLVADDARAWHAGIAVWGGRSDINSASIGIELDNDGSAPFTEVQIERLLALLDDLCTRLKISRQQIWAHGDVAPARKRDPHAGFPWQRLADAGFGLWPRAQRPAVPEGFDPWLALRLIGYDLSEPSAAVRAYRRHFRGDEAEVLDAIDHSYLHDLQLQLLAPLPAQGPRYPTRKSNDADTPDPPSQAS